MYFDVILQKQPDSGYIARPVLCPDSSVHGTTEQEAVNAETYTMGNIAFITKG